MPLQSQRVGESRDPSEVRLAHAGLGEEFSMNARPMADLADGEYKVVLFLRASYEPEVNIAEIEVPFTVVHVDD